MDYDPQEFYDAQARWKQQSFEQIEQNMIDAATRKPNPVYETMTKWTCGGVWTVRVWADSPQFACGPDQEILAAMTEWDGLAPRLFVHGLAVRFPRIAAIELLDPSGCGGLYYPDWK